MGLGQYNRLGEYCGPHTGSSVFLILVFVVIFVYSLQHLSGHHSYILVGRCCNITDIEHHGYVE